MSRKAIKKSLNRSFRKSAEYSATLAFGVMFLFSSMYSLPNFSFAKSINNASDSKNLKTTSNTKIDSSYKRYCNSDDHGGVCNYVAINDDALVNAPVINTGYKRYISVLYSFNKQKNLSIRAPPIAV
jgi:hypothetical protein